MTLQERLRALTAPCREVDARFYISRNPEQPFMVHPGSVRYKKPAEYEPLGQVDFTGFNATGWETIADTVGAPHYTASLDAAVELVERELPSLYEPEWSLENTDYGYWACVGNEYSTVSGQAHSIPAVALLLALIESKGLE